MHRFVLLVEFQVKPECLTQFNEAIAINARASVGTEPGCRQFDVLHTTDDPCHVYLYEVYDSVAAFDAHMGMAHTKTFLALAKDLVNRQSVVKLERTVAPPAKVG